MNTAPLGSAEAVAQTGRLWLVPNTLDLGGEPVALDEVLPAGVIRLAARLQFWLCEDARSTRAFLKRVEQFTPLASPLQSLSITELPKARKGSQEPVPEAAWKALLAPALAGQEIGLISEAGLPAVADPGALVVAQAHALQIDVQPLPGASALLLALAASGLNGQSFAFVGYLPQDPGARAQRIKSLETLSRQTRQTQICIETPYRNGSLLAALIEHLHPRSLLSVSAGLTMEQGWTRSGSVTHWRREPVQMPAKLPAVFAWLADSP